MSVQMMMVTEAEKTRCGTEQLSVGHAVVLAAVVAAAAASETARAVERTNSMSR